MWIKLASIIFNHNKNKKLRLISYQKIILHLRIVFISWQQISLHHGGLEAGVKGGLEYFCHKFQSLMEVWTHLDPPWLRLCNSLLIMFFQPLINPLPIDCTLIYNYRRNYIDTINAAIYFTTIYIIQVVNTRNWSWDILKLFFK